MNTEKRGKTGNLRDGKKFISVFVVDIILAVTFWLEGLVTFSIVTIVLVLLPNIIVQIFSARWNKIDETFNGSTKFLHGCLLGTLHRFVWWGCYVVQRRIEV